MSALPLRSSADLIPGCANGSQPGMLQPTGTPDATCADVPGVTPTSCNTGVQTPLLCVDCLQFTLSPDHRPKDLQDLLGGSAWEPMSRGAYGYRNGLRRGDLYIYFDGQATMGPHAEIRGSGCRQLCTEGRVADWSAFFREALEAGVNFTRVDLALDDRAGLLSMDAIRAAMDAGLVVSRLQDEGGYWCKRRGTRRKPARQKGKTLTFGAPSSDTKIRIYDKALKEQVPGPWTRVEIELRRKRAHAAAVVIAKQDMGIVAGLLKNTLDFKRKGRSPRPERWSTETWWSTFLGDCTKLRLDVAKHESSAESKDRWLREQVAPSLAILYAEKGIAGLMELVREGSSRVGSRR